MFLCSSASVKVGSEICLPPFSYSFPDSGIIGLVGKNGSGKTTLLNVLCGYIAPTLGACTLDGVSTSTIGPIRLAQRGIHRAFQVPRIAEGMTVADNIRLGGEIERAAPVTWLQASDLNDISSRSVVLGLTTKLNDAASSLSVGQKRRLSFSYFFQRKSLKALLMDEPFAGLDTAGAAVLAEIMRNLVRTLGCLIIVAEHHEDTLREITAEVLNLSE